MPHNEIAHATDGALRVARRQLIMAGELGQRAHDRLELDEYGDETREGVFHTVMSCTATGFQSATKIERELDERGAEYKPRSEVRNQV